MFKVTGKIFEIKPIQVVSDKFSKRELWLELPDDKFPQTLCFEFANKLADKLNEFRKNDKVEITFGLRGRIFKERCYNALSGIDIVDC